MFGLFGKLFGLLLANKAAITSGKFVRRWQGVLATLYILTIIALMIAPEEFCSILSYLYSVLIRFFDVSGLSYCFGCINSSTSTQLGGKPALWTECDLEEDALLYGPADMVCWQQNTGVSQPVIFSHRFKNPATRQLRRQLGSSSAHILVSMNCSQSSIRLNASMTGHASTLEGLMRKLKLAGSCALVNIFFVIVLTESGALSEQMANEVKSKVIRLGFPAMKPRALTPVQLTQMRGMATTKIHILSSNSARVQESIQKARPGAPRCSPEDTRIENFGERVWCHHAGNPTSTDNCQSCIRIYKQYTDQHLAEKYLINKICGGHNYMDYVLTDGGLKLIQQECPQCTHFLVTNGDNIYSKVCHERL